MMKKVIVGVILAAGLAGCGYSADTVTGDDNGYKFHGKPIDCMQTGAGDSKTLTCDFVGWHARYDSAQ